MSNLSDGPGTSLYAHEKTHVMQNRLFGPFFVLSYIGWMVVMFIPGLIAGLASGRGIGDGIEKWCYFNNPWEAWGYAVGHKRGAADRSAWGSLIWSDGLTIGISVPYFLGFLAVSIAAVAAAFV